MDEVGDFTLISSTIHRVPFLWHVMTRQLGKWCILLFGVVLVYAGAPFLAGLFGLGFRDGPRIYPADFHCLGYVIGYELAHEGEKPRSEPFRTGPLFYGMKPGWLPRPSDPYKAEMYDRVRSRYQAARAGR